MEEVGFGPREEVVEVQEVGRDPEEVERDREGEQTVESRDALRIAEET